MLETWPNTCNRTNECAKRMMIEWMYEIVEIISSTGQVWRESTTFTIDKVWKFVGSMDFYCYIFYHIPIWNLIHYRKSIFTFAFIFILSVTPASSLRARQSTDPSRKEQSIHYKEGGEPFYVHYIFLITEKMSSCKISPMGRETVLQSSISKLTILSDAKWIHLKPIKNKQKPKLFTHFSTNSFENRIHFGLIAHQNERETMIFQYTWAK